MAEETEGATAGRNHLVAKLLMHFDALSSVPSPWSSWVWQHKVGISGPQTRRPLCARTLKHVAAKAGLEHIV